MSDLETINQSIETASEATWKLLSVTGREAVYPADIPFQAAQASGADYNATIGQITDGRGQILQLPTIAERLQGLPPNARNRALLYSPIGGQDAVRRAWRERERRQGAQTGSGGPLPASSLPLVTSGLTHALALAADLFGGVDRAVLVPDPCWGNYRQVFALRTGARLVKFPFYRDGRFWPRGLLQAASQLSSDEPAVVILNFPSNPGGYMPTSQEREELLAAIEEMADQRPLAVLCDEAYAGLVFDDTIPRRSLFWDLCGRHQNLVPIRASGATKEFLLFGARVGFLTLPWDQDEPIAAALDNKLRCLLRAGVGSPVSLSQMVLLEALEEPDIESQVDEVLSELARRCVAMRSAVERVADGAPFRLLPCNAGAFLLLELDADIDSEVVRRHLLEEHSTGVVAVGSRYIRLAFCSTATGDIDELVARVVRGVSEVADR